MPIQFNHTVVACVDREKSAAFFVDLFNLPEPVEFGPFLAVHLANNCSLDFAQQPAGQGAVAPQHYAFLVSEDEFDHVYGRIKELGLDHWADPRQHGVNQINHNDGGRGVYFLDPSGHYLEAITVPYGGW
ncbi:VOC family protein [Actinokineospora sp. G85]|uniref:VOC family protein n=1 Tax=Actinokineospora sp. G85 TaxID=3406626 RepID=UPI003C770800